MGRFAIHKNLSTVIRLCHRWPKIFFNHFWSVQIEKIYWKNNLISHIFIWMRAKMAHTYGPPNPKYYLLLIQTVAKSCTFFCSCLLSLLSLLSRCQMYFQTSLLQLKTIADMFFLVCSVISHWVTNGRPWPD